MAFFLLDFTPKKKKKKMRPSELDSFSLHSTGKLTTRWWCTFSQALFGFSDLSFESKYDFPSKIDLQPGRDKLPLKNICC